MGERRRRHCPLCGGTGAFCGKCYRCSGKGYVLAICPTIRVMEGGETGSAGCGADVLWVWHEYDGKWTHPDGDTWGDDAPGCPAPTPRAP